MRIQLSIASLDDSRVRKYLTKNGVKIARGLFDVLNSAIVADGGKPLTILKHGGARRVKKSTSIKRKGVKNGKGSKD